MHIALCAPRLAAHCATAPLRRHGTRGLLSCRQVRGKLYASMLPRDTPALIARLDAKEGCLAEVDDPDEPAQALAGAPSGLRLNFNSTDRAVHTDSREPSACSSVDIRVPATSLPPAQRSGVSRPRQRVTTRIAQGQLHAEAHTQS